MSEQYALDQLDAEVRLSVAWKGVLSRLADDIQKQWFEKFLRPLRPLRIEDGVATVGAPGRFIHEWVSSRYLGLLESALSDELGQSVKLELKIVSRDRSTPDDKEPEPLASSNVWANSPAPDASGFEPNPRYTFESFVVGQSNRLAHAGAVAVSEKPGEKYNPLFIYGISGLGKTHLLHAIAGRIYEHRPKTVVKYISAQQFAEEFVNALQTNHMEQFRRAQRAVDVWLIDDIQFVAGKEKTQEEIFHTFNHLYSYGKQIVVCSDRPPRDLFLMGERLRSRFEAGLVADVQMPDTETRCAILISKARQEQIELDHEVAMYMALNVPGNIRQMEGALTKLAAEASLEGCPLDVEFAQRLVERYFKTRASVKPQFEQIVDYVGRHYRILPAEIKGISRKAQIAMARHVAIYVVREITRDSWKHIGALFGNKDHTSMMHGYQKVREMMNSDKELETTVKTLIRDLYPDS